MLADLAPAFPGSSQVQLLGLECADDKLLWRYAKDHGFMIVTLDSAFTSWRPLRCAAQDRVAQVRQSAALVCHRATAQATRTDRCLRGRCGRFGVGDLLTQAPARSNSQRPPDGLGDGHTVRRNATKLGLAPSLPSLPDPEPSDPEPP